MKKLILSIVLSICLSPSFASHIIGSEMTYQYLGNDDYKIRLTLYKDCSSFTPIPFDAQSYITVFKGDNSLAYSYPLDTGLVSSYHPDSVEQLSVELSNPCWIPPSNVCIDKTSYEFIIDLPFDSLGYFIIYQRCCRDNLLMNISNSGQTGMTNFLFISQEGQQLQNNSPTFSKNPPVAICNDKTNYVDCSATDIDGDSLVYSLCQPYSGATPMVPQPQVMTAPPFPLVNYSSGFTAIQPINGSIVLDGATGIMTVSPTAIGQYVVGICVDEYRNDILIGSIRRDIILIVTDCPNTIFADIAADSIGLNRDYYVNATDTTVTFINQSGQAQFIDDYLWEIELDSQTVITSTLTNPTITFSNKGTYHGKLIVNPYSTTCQDSLFIIINIPFSTRNFYLSKNNDIQIFPNPVQDFLIITFQEPFFDKKRMEIFDIKGKLVKTVFINPNQNNIQITVKDLPTGNYILKIENQTFKIIKP